MTWRDCALTLLGVICAYAAVDIAMSMRRLRRARAATIRPYKHTLEEIEHRATNGGDDGCS